MTTSNFSNNKYAEAIIYNKIELPSLKQLDENTILEWQQQLVLLVQGAAVELEDKYPLIVILSAFGVIHRFSPEMVLNTDKAHHYLIFDHQPVSVLRPPEIITKFSNWGKQLQEQEIKQKPYQAEVSINIENIYHNISEDDLETKIQKSLLEIAKLIFPSDRTVLIGQAPSLLFLLVYHLLLGKTGQIYYQADDKANPFNVSLSIWR
ncbi:MAG: hypothetical protein BWY48_00220 [Parcubacteria group bacterium ADurb.Bin305]|jgi:hypothetical protein|nr:MAG: hypothetical protein BWY48_00220 [Parcubacteria group bacterium ADurb.Bin305]